MAVSLVTTIKRFMGVHADDKPTDCPPGSTFYEFDTKATYVFDGTDWYAQ